MIVEKTARETLTAVELDIGDELIFHLADGTSRRIVVDNSWGELYQTDLEDFSQPRLGARTVCRCACRLRIDGHLVTLVRWIGSQRSFYEPWELFGMRIWFDAAGQLFDVLNETHGPCKPRKHARFAIQDATRRICPVLLHPWCPLPEGGLRIEDCYEGADCWMGPYFGADAHGGLDINHPAGTPIWAPFEIDEHVVYDHVDRGDSNSRWQGLHRWADGAAWMVRVCHIIRLRVDESAPIAAGTHYADGAGVRVGNYEHSHFVFGIREPGAAEGEEILLDPWILFWQMYRDRQATAAL